MRPVRSDWLRSGEDGVTPRLLCQKSDSDSDFVRMGVARYG